MSETVLVALLSLLGTLAGSAAGIVTSGRMTAYRIAQLEKKVAQHNRLVERTYVLEGQMREVQHTLQEQRR